MKACIYIRVSTQKQGISGLGLEAQREICMDYINKSGKEYVTEFKDVESGKSRTREGLLQAIDFCKENKCELVFAKLDRMCRDVEFTFKVINTGVQVHFCDVPQLNTLILGVMASVAQYERELISQRTKAALKAKKERGEKTGGACRKTFASMRSASESSAKSRRKAAIENPHNKAFLIFLEIWEAKRGKVSGETDWREMADELNRRGNKTSTGKPFDNVRARAMYVSLKNIYMDSLKNYI